MKKGFTLIELLAVIVVLAIIALIATPQILNVVEKARKGAAKSSALGYVDAVEKQIMVNQLNENPEINDGEYSLPMDNTYKISVKGSKPTSGSLTITKSKVVSASMCINNYTVTYNGKTATVGNKCNGSSSSEPQSTFGGTKVSAQPGETHKGIVYLDPTDLSKECNATLASQNVNSNGTPTEVKTGCMKWYIFDDSGDNYTMILDHNTTAILPYDVSGTYKEYDQASIKTQVEADTAEWVSGLNQRIITANEIAAITGHIGWDNATASYTDRFYFDSDIEWSQSHERGVNKYAWLFDYIVYCHEYGCNTEYKHPDSRKPSTYGYWTSSYIADPEFPDWAWFVDNGSLNFNSDGDVNAINGIRPVITISKSLLN